MHLKVSLIDCETRRQITSAVSNDSDLIKEVLINAFRKYKDNYVLAILDEARAIVKDENQL